MLLAFNFFAGKNLKVKQPEKYNWDPKWMLDHLIDIYLHLDTKTLAAALANDQRTVVGGGRGAEPRVPGVLAAVPAAVVAVGGVEPIQPADAATAAAATAGTDGFISRVCLIC